MLKPDKDFSTFVYEEVRHLIKVANDEDKLLSNTMLLVSTGAFGLSVNFFINKGLIIKYPIILKTSWIFLAAAILIDALGYFLSRENDTKTIDFLNTKVADPNFILTPQEFNKYHEDSKQSWIHKAINILNYASFGAFFLGVLSLTIFSIIQL